MKTPIRKLKTKKKPKENNFSHLTPSKIKKYHFKGENRQSVLTQIAKRYSSWISDIFRKFLKA
jgi:hypothetical protein